MLVIRCQRRQLARLHGNEGGVLDGEAGVEVDEGDKRLSRPLRRADPVLGVGQQTLADVDQQFAQELLFALEVPVHGGTGHTHPTAYVVKRHGAVAALGEQGRRRLQQLLPRRAGTRPRCS